jgi:hypothetical protein
MASAASGGWTKVPHRSSNEHPIDLQSFQQTVVAPVSHPLHSAPSAITVWRAQGAFR